MTKIIVEWTKDELEDCLIAAQEVKEARKERIRMLELEIRQQRGILLGDLAYISGLERALRLSDRE